MAKKTFETTFGTRIQNAQVLINNLQGFAAYKFIRSEDSIDELKKLVNTIQQSNNEEATALQSYTLAVDARQKIFDNETVNIKDLVTSIMATLRAQYGKTSKEVTSLVELANKTRGTTKRKIVEGDQLKKVSNSQQSYASILQNFSDLVASLEALNPPFNPSNPNITIIELKKFVDIAREASNVVSNTTIALEKVRQNRNELYKDLTMRTQRVKEAVKGQYGTKSNEFMGVKSLKI